MPKVHFLNENVTFEVASGVSVQNVADDHGINLSRGIWPGASCKNMGPLRGWCGRCSVWVRDPASKPNPLGGVGPMAKGMGKVNACKTLVTQDLEVRTRPGFTLIKESTDNWAPDPRPSKWKERLVKAKAAAAGGAAEEAEEPEAAEG